MKTKTESNGLGIASMVIGLVGVLFGWIPFFGLPFGIIGLTLGLVQKDWRTNGAAITGVALNSLWLLIQLVWIVFLIIGIMAGY